MAATFSTNAAVSLERQIEQDENHVVTNLWDKNELERCSGWITDHGYLKVCLQFPDSYLSQSIEIAEQLKAGTAGAEIFILGDTSYGACCVDEVSILSSMTDNC
jgi:diphthamide biosynthesis protein 2